MPKLSVIIPVYKVEDYLERCVRSVLNQSYKDVEVVLVDDGSPDRCPQICDELATEDNRIKVVHKKNGGLASARNEGIMNATGEYLAFLDSDDQWSVEKLGAVMDDGCGSDAEMVLFDTISTYADGHMMKRVSYGLFDGAPKELSITDYYAKIISAGDFQESACTKIFKRDFIVSNDLLYCLGITGEDSEWMFRVLRKVTKVLVLDTELFLCTCQREGSIQNSIKAKNIRDVISTIEKVEAYNQEHKDSPLMHYELEQCAYLLGNATGLLHYIADKGEKKELKNKLRSKAYLFDYATNSKTSKMKKVYKILGFNLLASMLELYLVLHKKNILNKKKVYHG